ncbi:MAG: hypothetical protein ACK5BV_03500 [Bacteroidota bacterium]|jgi:hypothetical protein
MASLKNPAPTLSKLVIDEQFRIWLPDYKNLEICLTPLPKTLYIFILKHPEGIRLKELTQHRKDILAIYAKIGNRLNLEQMKQSIKDLTDMRSNSVHEKCSRIRQAFSEKLHLSVANQYYINGSRNQPKVIPLSQNLITLPDGL